MKSIAVCLSLFFFATMCSAQPAPPAPGSIKDLLLRARQDKVSTFVQAAQAAGLFDTLSKDGPYMLFVPLNDAFKNLPEGVVGKLITTPPDLLKVLLHHVVKGNTAFGDLKTGDLTTMAGGIIKVVVSPTDKSVVTVNNGKIYPPSTFASGVLATNGVIHFIDQVLLP